MKIKFPLYAKILFWFFLNVVFLGAVFLIVARVQFKFGLDSLVNGPAGENIQKVTQSLRTSLRNRPRSDWNEVLKEFSDIYKVRFFLFRNDGGQIAGDEVNLPPEVRARIPNRRGMGPPPGEGRGVEQQPEFDGPPEQRPIHEQGERRPPLQPDGPPQRAMVHTTTPNRYWVVIHTPVPNPDQPPPMMPAVLVVASDSLSGGGLFFDFKPWAIAVAGVFVVSALFWFPLVRGITSSISRMTQATGQIAEGRFEVRTQVERQDELGSLSDAINQMAERLAGLVGGQKRFLGDIAHELCSPIARIQVALGILEQRADARQKDYLNDLREEVEQMSELVNELLSFSKASAGRVNIKLQAVAIRAVVEKAAGRESSSGGGADVKVNVAEDLRAVADPELLLRAVGNVLRNAIRYAGNAGPITVSAMREGEKVVVMIEDCGAGIPEDALGQVFDPFYRVDSSRTRETGGVGLGLSIVKTCVESCGGTVSCENRQPAGLRVLIKLQSWE